MFLEINSGRMKQQNSSYFFEINELELKSEWYFNKLDRYKYISFDLCTCTSVTLRIRLENFEGVLLASVWFNIHVAMTSGRLSFASVEIDKIIPQLDPDENVCVAGGRWPAATRVFSPNDMGARGERAWEWGC